MTSFPHILFVTNKIKCVSLVRKSLAAVGAVTILWIVDRWRSAVRLWRHGRRHSVSVRGRLGRAGPAAEEAANIWPRRRPCRTTASTGEKSSRGAVTRVELVGVCNMDESVAIQETLEKDENCTIVSFTPGVRFPTKFDQLDSGPCLRPVRFKQSVRALQREWL